MALTTEVGPRCATGSIPISVVELQEPPDGPRQPIAVHEELGTTLHVIDGVVYLLAGDDDFVLTPGDSATVAPGTAYRRWNAGDDEARWVEVYCR
jgi:quercetin dioxygenase-like cupin family protein